MREVFEKLYILEGSKHLVLRELQGSCPRVMAAPGEQAYLSSEDVAGTRF